MPEPYRDLVNRILRDREGYEGDGKGGVGALPEGDRSTAARPILKSDLRQAILAGEIAVDSALDAAERAEAAALAATTSSPVVIASDMAELLASPNAFTVGTVFLTRRELTVTEAVDAGGDYVTAGGTRLRDITPDPQAKRNGGFFANGANPGSFTRLANRVFVGDAWNFTGATQGNNAVETWLHSSGGAKVQPGTVSVTNGSVNVVGAGTQFTLLAPSGTVTIGGSVYTIASITSNTSMTLTTPATRSLSGISFSAGTATLQYLATFANLLSVRNYGIGVTGAVSTSTTNSGFGGAFVAKTSAAGSQGWGLYVEGIKAHASADNTHGMEIEVANLHPTVSDGFKPYGGRVPGAVWGLTVGSGADPVVNPVTYSADTGISVTGVGSNFMSGMVFEHDALAVHGDGRKRAVLLPVTATISWWAAGNNKVFDILSSASTQAKSVTVQHNDVGLTFTNGAGNPFLFVNRGPDGAAVDYVSFEATNNQGAMVRSGGPRAHVHLRLEPKGNGNVVIPLSSLKSYGSDTAAAADGVPEGGLYRSGNDLKIRLPL